ncbi:hypothetical protein QQF54_08520 [Lelliottia sp. V106_10]|uniref:hypothetical protein n=1 Tax=Lelliottia wanjuensis TaxID=3050585 RepID=UPI00254F8EFB|nr:MULTISPECIES: hypothetical protein [unclassified Lelliottia]MDK9373397.1 hypothetical protein [Lelliottia sp. V106_10]MDK9600190.1 hypothetical protein [Lelliottia sp. V106_5]
MAKAPDKQFLFPVDRVAARVTSKGVHYEPDKKCEQGDSELPLPTLQRCELDYQQRAHLDALKGHRFGRMAVIGIAALQPTQKKGGMRFVVRCACGVYTYRRSQAIRNPKNKTDCCDNCRHLLHLKRSEIYRRTGKEVSWEEL